MYHCWPIIPYTSVCTGQFFSAQVEDWSEWAQRSLARVIQERAVLSAGGQGLLLLSYRGADWGWEVLAPGTHEWSKVRVPPSLGLHLCTEMHVAIPSDPQRKGNGCLPTRWWATCAWFSEGKEGLSNSASKHRSGLPHLTGEQIAVELTWRILSPVGPCFARGMGSALGSSTLGPPAYCWCFCGWGPSTAFWKLCDGEGAVSSTMASSISWGFLRVLFSIWGAFSLLC